MACITATGTVTASGRAILSAAATPSTAQQVADTTGLPVFRVRSALRELAQAGLVTESAGRFQAAGKESTP